MRRFGLLAAVVLVVGLAGCGDDADTDAEQTSRQESRAGPATDADADDAAESPAEGIELADAGRSPLPSAAQVGRRVIRTAELVLETADTARTADEAMMVASQAGGFVAETDLSRDADGVVSGTITLRVPAEALVETVEKLDALGDAVPVRRIDERDVTSEATDLNAQRTNLSRYEEELRALLSDVRTTTSRPDDLLTVFERVRTVREELDRVEARLSVLEDQVSLATIHLVIRPTPAAVPVVDPTWEAGETVRAALGATARAMTSFADVAIWLILTVLPILVVLAAPLVVAYAIWRGRRRPTPPPSAPAPS